MTQAASHGLILIEEMGTGESHKSLPCGLLAVCQTTDGGNGVNSPWP